MSDFITSITPLRGGSGTTVVTITCSKHTGREERTATRQIKYKKGAAMAFISKTLTIRQLGKPEFVSMDSTEIEVSNNHTFVLNGISNASELLLKMGANDNNAFFSGNESVVLTINNNTGETITNIIRPTSEILAAFTDIEEGKTEAYNFSIEIHLTSDEVDRTEDLKLQLNDEEFTLNLSAHIRPVDVDENVSVTLGSEETEAYAPINASNSFDIIDFGYVETGTTPEIGEVIQP